MSMKITYFVFSKYAIRYDTTKGATRGG